jgi:hypothetical protein
MMSHCEEASDVAAPMPKAPRIPSIPSVEEEMVAEAKEALAAPPAKPRSEVAAAGALFMFLLGLMTVAFGAVMLVMFR